MPWTPLSFRARHNRALSPAQAKQAAAIANAVLKRTGDEALAIRAANARVKPSRAQRHIAQLYKDKTP